MVKADKLRYSIAANYFARFLSIALAVLFTPVYIKLLGIEQYGLIGFYTTLQAVAGLFELGLGLACTREMARLSVSDNAAQRMRDTLRTFEIVYVGTAIVIGLALSALSPQIAHIFLNTQLVAVEDRVILIALMAWIIALRWPFGLYLGVLNGLQRQGIMNVLVVTGALLNWAGGALVLLLSGSIQIFFIWQLAASVLTVAASCWLTWRCVPTGRKQPVFSREILRSQQSLIGSAGLNGILGVILMQADKLILSAILPLKEFAYYALASTMAEALMLLATPISSAIAPRMTQMISLGNTSGELNRLFHQSCQWINLMLIPVGLMVAIFSTAVLFAYTGSQAVAENTDAILSILIVAKLLHGNMLVPYALQIGWGELRMGVFLNLASVLFLTPALYLLAPEYGAMAGAMIWLTVTLGYVFIGMPLFFRKLMPGEWWGWLIGDLAVPAGAVAAILWVMKSFQDAANLERSEVFFRLVANGSVAFLVALLALASVRNRLVGKFILGKKQ